MDIKKIFRYGHEDIYEAIYGFKKKTKKVPLQRIQLKL